MSAPRSGEERRPDNDRTRPEHQRAHRHRARHGRAGRTSDLRGLNENVYAVYTP